MNVLSTSEELHGCDAAIDSPLSSHDQMILGLIAGSLEKKREQAVSARTSDDVQSAPQEKKS